MRRLGGAGGRKRPRARELGGRSFSSMPWDPSRRSRLAGPQLLIGDRGKGSSWHATVDKPLSSQHPGLSTCHHGFCCVG